MEETKRRKRKRTVKLSEESGGRTRDCGHKKRKSTLTKKAEELATLCDVMVCLVCYGPDGEVDTWPEDRTLVRDAIIKYKELRGTPMLMKKAEERYGLLELLESKKRKLLGKQKVSLDNLFSFLETRISESSTVEELMGLCSKLDAELYRLGSMLSEEKNKQIVQQQQRNGVLHTPPDWRHAYGNLLIGGANNSFMPAGNVYPNSLMEEKNNQQIAVQFSNCYGQGQENGAVFQQSAWGTSHQSHFPVCHDNEIGDIRRYSMLPDLYNSSPATGTVRANPGRFVGT